MCLITGHVDVILDGIPALIPHVREGQLRALAVGSQGRVTYVPGLENTPGMQELLLGSSMDREFGYCLHTPAAMPLAIVQAQQRDYGEPLLPLGFAAACDESPASFADFIRSKDAVWRELMELPGARLD